MTTRLTGAARAAVALVLCIASLGVARAQSYRTAEQGSAWTDSTRSRFYRIDQGSRLLPLSWLQALAQEDGTPFIASLPRYGFLPDVSGRAVAGLPIGFATAAASRGPVVGLGCAACHVREVAVGSDTLRIDGAPAFVDLGRFLADLDAAAQRVLATDPAFTRFAQRVLGAESGDATARQILQADLRIWSARFHILVAQTLPRDRPWGPGRFDSVAMAFNSIAGLSVGPRPTYLIPANIAPGRAPVRSAALWDSVRQDRADWTGIAAGGGASHVLVRGLAELYGDFGRIRPVVTPGALGPLNRDYLLHNSASFDGLSASARLVEHMGAPAWPWPVATDQVERGRAIFELPTTQGGCAECHGEVPGDHSDTWKTPVLDVGTDRSAWRTLQRSVDTGSMAGASLPGSIAPLQPHDQALNLLRLSVAGTLIGRKAEEALASPVATLIGGLFAGSTPQPVLAEPLVENGYTARVLHGIWAAAPYLHDGSVPTLSDLLMPADKRPRSFAVGTAYDPARVGLASQQTSGSFVLDVTGCDDVNSGNSNCGHDYGTRLSDKDKKALLEFLKTL